MGQIIHTQKIGHSPFAALCTNVSNQDKTRQKVSDASIGVIDDLSSDVNLDHQPSTVDPYLAVLLSTALPSFDEGQSCYAPSGCAC